MSTDDEDEFAFLDQSKKANQKAETQKRVSNQPYDEAEDISDDSGDDGKLGAAHTVTMPKSDTKEFDESGDESSSEDDDDDEAPATKASAAKLYDPTEYEHLQVSQEVQDLFDYIGRYKPQEVELETKLKPFIPDYIPAIGEIDPFLKVARPDDAKDMLGLVTLDEPATQQSDPTVLEMHIRVVSKDPATHAKPMSVRSIEHADKNPRRITTFIQSIEEVHRKKPPPTVVYTKPMPDIEQLLQAWPSEFEQLLKSTPLPTADMDMDLSTYARVICALLDIPVYDKLTESLHVLFTLFSEFKSNAHFNKGV